MGERRPVTAVGKGKGCPFSEGGGRPFTDRTCSCSETVIAAKSITQRRLAVIGKTWKCKRKKLTVSPMGLVEERINQSSERLRQYHERFGYWMKTKTRDTSEHGPHYLSGLLPMESKRPINLTIALAHALPLASS
jgi:hypothetical protein